MRLVLLAWVAGVWWLQQASALPAGRWFAVVVSLAFGVLSVGAIRGIWRNGAASVCSGGRAKGRLEARAGARPESGTSVDHGSAGGSWRHRCAVGVLAVSAGVCGYGWAALRAESRLSDALPVALEGRDITVVGVVSGLPTNTGDGVRFLFDVERAYFVAEGCVLPWAVVERSTPGTRLRSLPIPTSVGFSASMTSSASPISLTAPTLPTSLTSFTSPTSLTALTTPTTPTTLPVRVSAALDIRRDAIGPACQQVHVPTHIELVLPLRSPFGNGQARRGNDAGKSGATAGSANASPAARHPRAGERWQLPVRLTAPRGFANWHGFDTELMALVRGIRASGYVRPANAKAAAAGGNSARRLHAGPLPGYRFAAWRERLRDDFRRSLGPSARYGGVLMALALGERGDIADDDWQVFADTGVSHLLAISGLHVSLVAGAAAALVGMLWRRACFRRLSLPLWWPSPKAAAVAGLLAALAYGAIAGWGVPVRRAVGMVAILVVALLNGRFAVPSYALAWALAVVVALDPWAVVTPGLWLSFGAVAALVMASRRRAPAGETKAGSRRAREKRVEEMVGGRTAAQAIDGTDEIAAASSRASNVCRLSPPRSHVPLAETSTRARHLTQSAPPTGWLGRRVVALGGRLGQAARAQYAVTIGLVPLTLAWFGTVPLLGPLANAVAIPVMTLIVTPLALASVLLPEPVAHWALAVAHEVVVWLADWLGTLAAWPWSVWRAAVAPPWAQVAAVAGVIVCLMPMAWGASGSRRAIAGRMGVRLAGLALMGPAVFASSSRPGEGEFRVTMLDIGQGNAVLVETATRTLLFDTGPPLGRRSDAGRRVIMPYLRSHGVARLDRLVVSHAHDDHFGGALSVLRAYPATQMFSSLPAGHRVRRAATTTHRTCLAGQQWTWDGVAFQFLHPDKATLREGWDGRAGPNSVSCVLRVSNGRHSALLAADAEAPQERAMLRRSGPELRADILLAPHHGSLTSSTAAFVEAVSPTHVVFQTGYRNRFGHPKSPVVARYHAAHTRIWRSVTHGGVRFSVTRDGIRAQAYREQYRRYWHADSPDTS